MVLEKQQTMMGICILIRQLLLLVQVLVVVVVVFFLGTIDFHLVVTSDTTTNVTSRWAWLLGPSIWPTGSSQRMVQVRMSSVTVNRVQCFLRYPLTHVFR